MRATKSAGNGCQVEQVNESGGIIVNRELPVDIPVMTKAPARMGQKDSGETSKRPLRCLLCIK